MDQRTATVFVSLVCLVVAAHGASVGRLAAQPVPAAAKAAANASPLSQAQIQGIANEEARIDGDRQKLENDIAMLKATMPAPKFKAFAKIEMSQMAKDLHMHRFRARGGGRRKGKKGLKKNQRGRRPQQRGRRPQQRGRRPQQRGRNPKQGGRSPQRARNPPRAGNKPAAFQAAQPRGGGQQQRGIGNHRGNKPAAFQRAQPRGGQQQRGIGNHRGNKPAAFQAAQPQGGGGGQQRGIGNHRGNKPAAFQPAKPAGQRQRPPVSVGLHRGALQAPNLTPQQIASLHRRGKRKRRLGMVKNAAHSTVNVPARPFMKAGRKAIQHRQEMKARRQNTKATHDQYRGRRNFFGRRKSQMVAPAKPAAEDYVTHKKRLADANRLERKKAKSVTGRVKRGLGVWKPTYYAHPASPGSRTGGHLHPPRPTGDLNRISGQTSLHEINEAEAWNQRPGKKKYRVSSYTRNQQQA